MIPEYVDLDRFVFTELGCENGRYPVSTIVANPLSLDPNKLEQWQKENPLAEFPPADIASGGWSRVFKNAFR